MKESTQKPIKSKAISHERVADLLNFLYEIKGEVWRMVTQVLDENGLHQDEIYDAVDSYNSASFKLSGPFNEPFVPTVPVITKNKELQYVIEKAFFSVELESGKNLCVSFKDGGLIDILQSFEAVMPKKIDYYNPEYREKRHKVFLRDGEVCAKCGAVPRPGVSLTIDHIKPVSKYPELFLDINNMQCLCWDCNVEKSNKHNTDYRG